MPAPTHVSFPHHLWRFLSSVSLCVILLLWLIVLTLLGTFSQKEIGLYDAQAKYFDSMFFREEVFGGAIYLPGAYLVLSILFVNIFCGGLLRFYLKRKILWMLPAHVSLTILILPVGASVFMSNRLLQQDFGTPAYLVALGLAVIVLAATLLKKRGNGFRQMLKHVGIFFAHSSILLLVIAGWRSFHAKKEGHMAILPNQETNLVQAYQDWQLEIREQGGSQVRIIRDHVFADCTNGKSRTFYQSGLPFQIKVSDYARNCDIVPEGDPKLSASAVRMDQFAILPQKVLPANEANVAGIIVEVIDANSNQSLTKAILGGTQGSPGIAPRPPLVVTVGEKRYALELTRERWQVPFKVKLNEFIIEKYSGLDKPKVYQSNITKTDADGANTEKVSIGMNEPMRRAGYVFFQASFGRNRETDPYYTVFAVVHNPSDQWPSYACGLAGLGLLTHFLIKLSDFLSRMARKRNDSQIPPALPTAV